MCTNLLCHIPSSIIPESRRKTIRVKAALVKGRGQEQLQISNALWQASYMPVSTIDQECSHQFQWQVLKVQSAWSPTSHNYFQAAGKKNFGPLSPSVSNLWVPWFNTKRHQCPIFDPYPYENSSIETNRDPVKKPARGHRKTRMKMSGRWVGRLLHGCIVAPKKYAQNVSRIWLTVADDLFPQNFRGSNVSIYRFGGGGDNAECPSKCAQNLFA